jgi:hypothetical protein
MADGNQPAIDETPISPSRPYPERKNSLEKHLTNRPSPDELRQSRLAFLSLVLHNIPQHRLVLQVHC